MSRSGYSDDYDEAFPNAADLYRNSVDRAIAGRRGQALLRDMLVALDAMPAKRLVEGVLVEGGEACALGAVALARGVDVSNINPENAGAVSRAFNISPALAREVAYVNDDDLGDFVRSGVETSEQRWERVRRWVADQILPSTPDPHP